jgi:hypothetical protein
MGTFQARVLTHVCARMNVVTTRASLLRQIAKSRALADFGDEEYRVMVCVEPGRVSEHESLDPGHRWTLAQLLQVHE